MKKREAAGILLRIMEAVEDAQSECNLCPFHKMADEYNCLFVVCPEMWRPERITKSCGIEV